MDEKKKAKTHGFQKPLTNYQIFTWIFISFEVVIYYGLNMLFLNTIAKVFLI